MPPRSRSVAAQGSATQGIFDTLGRIAMSFQSAPPDMPGIVWNELRPWIAQLMLHAVPKWLPRMTVGFPCAVPVYEHGQHVGPCPHGAVAICDVCQQPCCLRHSRIDSLGDAICYMCVAQAVRERRAANAANGHVPPPNPWGQSPPGGQNARAAGPSAEEITWARKTLKVKASATEEEIRSAHRKLSGEWHPDRHQGEREKAKAEAKFKDIQRALEILKQVASAS